MRLRTYFSLFLIISIVGIGCLYIHLSSKETFVPGIPEAAIRLRILANSDQLEDQMVKRKVRDEIVKEMNSWVRKPKSIQEARLAVNTHLPRFQEIADKTVARYGYTYPVKVDFGQVPFPTKLYGNQVYAAGNYEALRITLGKGEGGNWWCVLFPPLCFVDMSNGDAVPKQEAQTTPPVAIGAQAYAASKDEEKGVKVNKVEKAKKAVEVRFLLFDKINELMR